MSTLPYETERGRKMELLMGSVFIPLMAVNVGVGLWLIARHESKSPNRALLEAQPRRQITKSLEHAATAALTPLPSHGVTEITTSVVLGRVDAVSDEVVAMAGRLGGSATKGLPDEHRIGVLVDLPSTRESEFRALIASLAGGASGSASPATTEGAPGSTTPATTEKKSFVVQIVESPAEQY